jgi:hypothetical protein
MDEDGFTTVELKKFSDAGRTIAAAIGTTVEVWARAEAGVILKQWAGRTPVRKERAAEIGGILRDYRQSRAIAYGLKKGETPRGTASINLGIRKGAAGRVLYRTRRNKFQPIYGAGFQPTAIRMKNEDWPALNLMVQNFRHQYRLLVDAAKGAVGLARQSIVQIADDLGIRLEDVKGGGTLSAAGIQKARNALASSRTPYRNGYGVISQNAKEFYITLVNRYPRMGPLFMDATLQRVIMGRLGYFRRNLEEGTFLSAKAAAKAYPYIEVIRLAA